jgi:hypothetical protein
MALVAAAIAAAGAYGAPVLRSAVGTNLEGLTAWSSAVPFVDVMKTSTPWISGDAKTWDNGRALDLDASGWVRSLAPGQIARKLMLREIGNRYPAGRYTVRYRGEGKLGFGFAAKVVASRPGEMILEVKPDPAGVQLIIESTSTTNPLRDIQVLLPGVRPEDAERILFNPAYLARLKGYSVLRFMDWGQTNNSPLTTWDSRPLVSDCSWATERGAPVEIMIELANRLGAHPWLTVPHRADDAYIAELARLVRERLRPDLSVYVEDSNEVWNAQFRQYAYAAQQAKALGIDNMQYHALRTRAIGEAFAAALGRGRVVTVLGAQAGNDWTASRGLDYLKGRFGSPGVDAVAIAPYLAVAPTPQQAPAFVAMGLDGFFSHVRTSVLPAIAERMALYGRLADSYGVALLAYEGGQHMVGLYGAVDDAALNALFDAFNRDPRMGELYLDYLAEWKRAGGTLFVHFDDIGRYTKWGRWGALEYVAQPRSEAPKFDALQTFIERNPPWWPNAR